MTAAQPTRQQRIDARLAAAIAKQYPAYCPSAERARLLADAEADVDAELRRLRAAARGPAEAKALAEAEAACRATHVVLTERLRIQIRHVVQLAYASEPGIDIHWYHDESCSARVIGRSHAVAHVGRAAIGRAAISTPAITCDEDVLCVLHEIGHHRTNEVKGVLSRELAAWQYAATNSLTWDEAAHEYMRTCLGTYLSTKDQKSNVPEMIEIERFMSDRGLAEIVKRRQRMAESLARIELEKAHGKNVICRASLCLSQKAEAVKCVEGVPLCGRCATNRETDLLCERMRRDVARMRSRR